MRAVVVFVALIVCALGAQYNDHTKPMATLQTLHSSLANMATDLPRPVHHLQDLTQQLCFTAWLNLSTLLNGTCGDVTALYSTNQQGLNVTSIIYNQCVKTDGNGFTCAQKVTLAIQRFSDACSGPGLGVLNEVAIETLALWTLAAKLPCIQYGGQLCYPIFREAVDAFNSSGAKGSVVSTAVLDEVCQPCVDLVLDVLATWATPSFVYASAQLKLVCLRYGGEYCFPVFQEATTEVTGFTNSTQLDLACNPCTILVAWRFYWSALLLADNVTEANEVLEFLELTDFLCQKDSNGDYCIPKVSAYNLSAIETNCGAVALGGSCVNTACQTAIQNFKTTAGCCFGTWFQMLEWYYTVNQSAYLASIHLPPSTIEDLVVVDCKVAIGASCATKRLQYALTAWNLREDWVLANLNFTRDAFVKILAYSLAITAEKIVDAVLTYDTATNSTILQCFINATSDWEAEWLNAQSNNQSLVSNSTNSVCAALRTPAGSSQQTQSLNTPVSFSAQSDLVNTTSSPNLGCYVSPSFTLAILAFIVSLVLMA